MTTTTYINGDKAKYTGKSEVVYGAMCYEAEFVEGHKIGTLAWTYNGPDGTTYDDSHPVDPASLLG